MRFAFWVVHQPMCGLVRCGGVPFLLCIAKWSLKGHVTDWSPVSASLRDSGRQALLGTLLPVLRLPPEELPPRPPGNLHLCSEAESSAILRYTRNSVIITVGQRVSLCMELEPLIVQGTCCLPFAKDATGTVSRKSRSAASLTGPKRSTSGAY